jgi:hypothetical protein
VGVLTRESFISPKSPEVRLPLSNRKAGKKERSARNASPKLHDTTPVAAVVGADVDVQLAWGMEVGTRKLHFWSHKDVVGAKVQYYTFSNQRDLR